MNIIYQCDLCKANYDTAEEALKCEAQGFHPFYEIGGKAIYQGAIVTINARQIVQARHSFIYRFSMLAEDNPGATISICGWQREDELSTSSSLQSRV